MELSLIGVAIGAAVAVPIGTVLFVLAADDRSARLIRDQRVAGVRGATLAYQTLVRVPIGTAATEEILFRGVLFAAFRDAGAGTVTAAVASSIIFGLWHISPTVNMVRMNRPNATMQATVLTIVGAVLFTTITGLALAWLRTVTGDLAAPWMAHAGVNSLATVASIRADRTVKLNPGIRTG